MTNTTTNTNTIKAMEVAAKSAYPTAAHSTTEQLATINADVKVTTYQELPQWNFKSMVKQSSDDTFSYKRTVNQAKAFSTKQILKNFGISEALTEQIILANAAAKAQLSKEESNKRISEKTLNTLNNAGLTIEDLKAVPEKDLRKLNAKKIVLSTQDEVDAAIATLSPSPAFIANLSVLLAEGYSYSSIFRNVKSAFTYTGGDEAVYGSAYKDALTFKKIFTFKKKLKGKLEQIVVRTAVIDDQETTNEIPNVSLKEHEGITMLNVVSKYKVLSMSQLASNIVEIFGEESKELESFRTQSGQLVKTDDSDEQAKQIRFISQLLYVDAAMDVEEISTDDEDVAKRKKELIDMRDAAVNNGIVVFEVHEGQQVSVGVFGAFIRTASQARTQGFIALQGAHDVDFAVRSLEALGHSFTSYIKTSKTNKDMKYIAVDKFSSRPGLKGTNAHNVPALNELLAGANVVEFGEDTGMRVIETKLGEQILLTPDFNAEIKKGLYRVLNAIKAYKAMADKKAELSKDELASQFVQLDAAQHHIELCVGDGQFFYGEAVHQIIINQFGKDNGVNQFRISPATKGLGVYYPNLEKETGFALILPESAVKVPYETIDLNEHPLEFAIANFGKEQGHLKNTFKLNYQFMSGLFNVNVDTFRSIVQNTFNDIQEIMTNPSKLHDYKNYSNIMESLTASVAEGNEEAAEEAAGKLIMTFDKVFAVNENVHNDVWIKVQAHKMMKEAFKRYGRGELQVEGNYRFMVQDPIGLIRHHRRNIDAVNNGKPELVSFDFNAKYATIQENTVYLPSNTSFDCVEQEVLAMRAPFIHPSEAQKLKARNYTAYEKLRKYNPSFVSSVIVFSGLDFAAFAMGGADFDGDKCGVVLDEAIVDQHTKIPTVIDKSIVAVDEEGNITLEEGCIFKDTARTFPVATSNKVIIDGWNVHFKEEDLANHPAEIKAAIFNHNKAYMLDSMSPSKVGLYTDYATKLLDALQVLTNRVKASTNDEEVKFLNTRIALLDEKVALLRIVQGWEIDRSKHGGAFENFLDLDFLSNPPEEVSLLDVNGNFVLNGEGNRVWASLTWLLLQRGKTPKQIIKKVLSLEEEYSVELNKNFDTLFTASSQSNITKLAFDNFEANFGEHVQLPGNITFDNMLNQVQSIVFSDQGYYNEINSNLYEMIKDYNEQLRNILMKSEDMLEKRLNENTFRYSYSAQLRIMVEIEFARKEEIEQLNESCTNQLNDYYNDLRLANDKADLLIGKAVYEIVYTRAIENYRRDPQGFNDNPAKGTSYFWNVASDYAVSLFAYMAMDKRYIAYNQAQIQKQIKAIGFEEVTISMFPPMLYTGDITEYANVLNAAVQAGGKSSILEAVRVDDRHGITSYMLLLNNCYVGKVAPNNFSKLGGNERLFIKTSGANNYVGQNGTKSFKTIELTVAAVQATTIKDEMRATYNQLAIENGHAF